MINVVKCRNHSIVRKKAHQKAWKVSCWALFSNDCVLTLICSPTTQQANLSHYQSRHKYMGRCIPILGITARHKTPKIFSWCKNWKWHTPLCRLLQPGKRQPFFPCAAGLLSCSYCIDVSGWRWMRPSHESKQIVCEGCCPFNHEMVNYLS